MAWERSGAIISRGLVLLVSAGFCSSARASQMGPGRGCRPLTARFISATVLKVAADLGLGGA